MAARKAPQLVGVLLGNSVTAEESALIAERYGGCPYCVSYTSAGCILSSGFFRYRQTIDGGLSG